MGTSPWRPRGALPRHRSKLDQAGHVPRKLATAIMDGNAREKICRCHTHFATNCTDTGTSCIQARRTYSVLCLKSRDASTSVLLYLRQTSGYTGAQNDGSVAVFQTLYLPGLLQCVQGVTMVSWPMISYRLCPPPGCRLTAMVAKLLMFVLLLTSANGNDQR